MVKVDAKGRVVLPKEVRESLGIEPGSEVEIHAENGQVIVEPEDDPGAILERMDELLAGIPEDRTPTPYEDLDPHSQEQVDTIRRQAQKHDADSDDE